MGPVREAFVPDAALDREAMESLQRDIAEAATFEDDFEFDLDALLEAGEPTEEPTDPPIVAGVDQAFPADRAVSAIVCWQDGEIVERASAVLPTEFPYIPGLLSFREGGSILAAFEALDCRPDVALFDGSGRIHFREAGLATHVGTTLDLPSIGVAKSLLCGHPESSLDRKLPQGTRIPILADDSLTAPDGTVVGYAVQTRQFENSERYVNPVYVSPGHRVSAETAAAIVDACTRGYKLPEPVRLADQYAGKLADEY